MERKGEDMAWSLTGGGAQNEDLGPHWKALSWAAWISALEAGQGAEGLGWVPGLS